MAHSYSKVYLQFVFAVKYRECLIMPEHATRIFQFVVGIIQHPKRGHKVLAINGMPDHLHIALSFHTTQSISSLARDVKAISSGFINQHQLTERKFWWQKGYGVFSYGQSQLDRLVAYVNNQQEHHKRHSFREEYERMLEVYQIGYNPEYIFDWI